jgi:putative adenylate-forming enzyme
MNALDALRVLRSYRRARTLDAVRDRAVLVRLQQRWLVELREFVAARSPYYRQFATLPFGAWPVLDKRAWMRDFDAINTVGARLAEVAEIAEQSESTRDFSPTWRDLTIGLSTGTSGSRGLFLVSRRERLEWAGTLLGRLLRGGLFARERIALILRAGSTLYDTVGALRLRFLYVDQRSPWPGIVEELTSFDPTVLVAPASVLRLLADDGRHALRPRRVISVAEVLDDLDRARIGAVFGVPVEQIYQATEGLLAVSCERGMLHLNEPYVLVEPEWQDSSHTRFVPIVTDLRRYTQPVIRYRLNDVLRVAPQGCACGRTALALEAVDGRVDDVLWLDGYGAPVAVFPDLLSRAIVNASRTLDDYEVRAIARGHWIVGLDPLPAADELLRIREEIVALVRGLGAHPPDIEFGRRRPGGAGKQRRITNTSLRCAS